MCLVALLVVTHACKIAANKLFYADRLCQAVLDCNNLFVGCHGVLAVAAEKVLLVLNYSHVVEVVMLLIIILLYCI